MRKPRKPLRFYRKKGTDEETERERKEKYETQTGRLDAASCITSNKEKNKVHNNQRVLRTYV